MKPQRRASFNSISISATQPWYENKTSNPNLFCSNQQKMPSLTSFPYKEAFRILPNPTGECDQLLRIGLWISVSFQGWMAWRGRIASVAERMCGYREELGNWALAWNMTLKFWRQNLYLIESNSFSRAFWVEMFSLQTSASIIDLTCIGMGAKRPESWA